MPIYEYQGQQYEMSTTDPQEAKNKILSYLGQPPKEEPSLLKKFASSAASLGDIVAGAPAFAVGAVGAPLVSTYQGLVEGKSPKEAAQEGRKFAEEVGTSKWATPFKSALEGAGYFDPQAYESEIARQAMGKVAGGIETVGEKVESATGGAIPKEQVQMIADVGMLAGIPGAGKVGKIAKEKLTEPTSADIAAARPKEAPIRETVPAQEAQAKQIVENIKKQETERTAGMAEQPELPLEAPNKFGVKPEEMMVDENGMPINVTKTLEAQKVERGTEAQPELFDTVPQEIPQISKEVKTANVGREGYEIPVTVDAKILKDLFEADQKESLVWNKDKAQAIREGAKSTGNIEVAFNESTNKFGINDGRHRLAIAAERGENATVFLSKEDVVKLQNRIKEISGDKNIPQIEIFGQPAPKIPPRQAAKAAYEADIPVQEKAAEILKTDGEQAATDFVDAYLNEERVAARQEQQQVVNAVANINPKLADAITPYRNISRDEALSAIKNAPDADAPTLGFTANQLKSRGRLGIEKIKNEGVRTSLAHLIGLRDEAGIRANTVLQGDNGIMRNLRKLETLLGEGRAGEVIRQIQEGQFNPDYKFNLDPEQMKVKDQIQQMFEQTRQEMERITGKPVKQIPNYFPSMFFGPFAVELRDANGRLVAFVTEKSAKEAKRAADAVIADLAKEGEALTATQPKYRKELQSEAFRNRGGLAPYFESMMDLLGSDDPLVQKAQQSVQNLVAKRAMDTRKVSQRFMGKAGTLKDGEVRGRVLGEQGSQKWKSAKENYRDAKDVLENYVRAFEDWKANQETAQFLNDVKEQTGATNSYNILQNYFDDIRADSGVLDKFTNELATSLARATGRDISGASKTGARKTADFMTKIWLGFYNPVAMGQNVLQPVHTLPKLVELASAGGSKDVITPFLTGMAQSLKDVSSLAGEKLLGKELTETARYMKEQEVIKPGLVESEGKTKIGHNIEKLGVSGGLLATEAFARATSFNIFREYLKASGLDEAQAREVAKNLTHEYMVNYESYAKPGILSQGGFAGELMGRLQSFKFNQFTQLANYVESAKRSKNPSAAITSLAVSIGMAGVSGMIGMDIAEGLYGALVSTGAVEPDTKSPRQMALDLGGPAAVGIPTAATGKWLSGSLSTNLLGDMSWRNIAPVVVGAFETLGKVPTLAKMAQEKITGEQLVPESEKAAALMAVTPATMRGVLEEKLLTDKEGRIVSPYTGETSYVKGPQDEGILSLTNIRSKERGETIARTVLQKAQEKRIQEERKKVTDKLKKFVDESVRKGTELNPDTVGKSLERIIELQGDPANTINSVLDFVKNNQLGDWFDRQLLSGNVTMTNVYKKLRALEQKQSIGK